MIHIACNLYIISLDIALILAFKIQGRYGLEFVKVEVCFYIVQYLVRWTAQRGAFPPPTDLFIPTPTRLLLEAF